MTSICVCLAAACVSLRQLAGIVSHPSLRLIPGLCLCRRLGSNYCQKDSALQVLLYQLLQSAAPLLPQADTHSGSFLRKRLLRLSSLCVFPKTHNLHMFFASNLDAYCCMVTKRSIQLQPFPVVSMREVTRGTIALCMIWVVSWPIAMCHCYVSIGCISAKASHATMLYFSCWLVSLQRYSSCHRYVFHSGLCLCRRVLRLSTLCVPFWIVPLQRGFWAASHIGMQNFSLVTKCLQHPCDSAPGKEALLCRAERMCSILCLSLQRLLMLSWLCVPFWVASLQGVTQGSLWTARRSVCLPPA